jgi:uncharacterized protein YjbJ (UPF0337 family)
MVTGPAGRTLLVGRWSVVGFTNKFGNTAQGLRGRIKRTVGELTGDRSLRASGRLDEVASRLKRLVQKITEKSRRRVRGLRR